ncbi:hypothetical protein AB0I81_39940 [Nonomuraea sp. NPDC050404]|uniref:hypothetical protein n=1 Tax=Nonomuraea sp. NPDC050404 TaxID=3155783 RepID=UPI0033D1E93A
MRYRIRRVLALAARRRRARQDQEAADHIRGFAIAHDPDATELLDMAALRGSMTDEAAWAMGETQ